MICFGLIRLTQGLYAIVDKEHVEYLSQWKWMASKESRGTKFYAVRFDLVDGKRIKKRMHRVIVEDIFKEEIKKGYVVDHINHFSLDNRASNLEIVTQTENMRRSPGWKKKGEKYGQDTT